MSFLDNLQSYAEDAFSNFTSQAVQAGLESFGFIQVGKDPRGNPTADQVLSGERGAPISSTVLPRATAENSALKNGFGFSFGTNGMGAMAPIAIILGFVGLAFLLRR